MMKWAADVRSGDSDNLEARAAVYYWDKLFPDVVHFTRGRDEDAPEPNKLLNYGYAVLRAVVARALVVSGLLPTLGIHHHNRYNAYCLADDVMEPYRPFVDKLVVGMREEGVDCNELTTNVKARLLGVPILDVYINGERSPLMVAMQQTTASLAKCYLGEGRRITYPRMKI
jgi:CRISPR-associated protein Cas1